MKRGLLMIAVVVSAVLAAQAMGQVTRFVIEDGDGGTSSGGGRVKNNGLTTLAGYRCASNVCTRDAPTAANEGVVLSGVGSYIFTATLSSGTFSGTGAVEFYVYVNDAESGNPPAGWYYVIGKDIVPTSGKSSIMGTVQNVSLRPGNYRLVARANAVGTSVAAPILTTSLRACQTETCAP